MTAQVGNSSSVCCTLSHFLCPWSSILFHLSLFLIFSLLPFSFHLSSHHLSFCHLCSHNFFSLFTFFFVISALFILCSVWSIVCLFSLFHLPHLTSFSPSFVSLFPASSAPPPCKISSLYPFL